MNDLRRLARVAVIFGAGVALGFAMGAAFAPLIWSH
jgi:hypothetical protein